MLLSFAQANLRIGHAFICAMCVHCSRGVLHVHSEMFQPACYVFINFVLVHLSAFVLHLRASEVLNII